MRRLPENLLSNQSGGCTVAYAPGVEPSGDVETWSLGQFAGKWNAVSGIIVLVDPSPCNVADFKIFPSPGFEITEILGYVAFLPGPEFAAKTTSDSPCWSRPVLRECVGSSMPMNMPSITAEELIRKAIAMCDRGRVRSS